MEALGELPKNFNIPLILSGGCGRAQHLVEGIVNPNVNAVSTANLLNFVGTGLHNAREFILQEGGNLSAN
jgi:imidazole glycerol phosphate synthase subunit HisF